MTEKKVVGWWEWIGWNGNDNKNANVINDVATTSRVIEEPKAVQPIETIPTTSTQSISSPEFKTGWERIKGIYENPVSMEKDVVVRVVRMSFLGGFLVGGATGYAQARHAYEINNVGRKYLSPSDAVKRKVDYAIVRFAKGGFGIGFKCALISGSIVLLATHTAAYREKFSSWYFPAISAIVGGVFAFPLGVLGSMKAIGLGISSGLTLSAVVHLYAMSIDKPVSEAYRLFKKDYEKELKASSHWDERVTKLMEAENIWWRQEAVRKLKKIDQERLSVHDD